MMQQMPIEAGAAEGGGEGVVAEHARVGAMVGREAVGGRRRALVAMLEQLAQRAEEREHHADGE